MSDEPIDPEIPPDPEDHDMSAGGVLARAVSGAGDQVVTSFVLMYEYFDPETGETHMATWRDPDSSPMWKHVGMLDLFRHRLLVESDEQYIED